MCAAVGVAVPSVSTPEDTGTDAPSRLTPDRPSLVGGLLHDDPWHLVLNVAAAKPCCRPGPNSVPSRAASADDAWSVGPAPAREA